MVDQAMGNISEIKGKMYKRWVERFEKPSFLTLKDGCIRVSSEQSITIHDLAKALLKRFTTVQHPAGVCLDGMGDYLFICDSSCNGKLLLINVKMVVIPEVALFSP